MYRDLLTVIAALSILSAAAQPILYKDISSGPTTSSYNFTGHKFFKASDNRIYFGARDSSSGPENLCYIDVDDKFHVLFRVGTNDYGYFDQFAEAGGEVFFAFGTNETGVELWKTDGTESGTVQVKDIEPGLSASNPVNLVSFHDKVYFTTSSGNVYVSDGTESGTIAISSSVTVSELIVAGNNLYANGSNATNGNELFKLNSAETDLVLVEDIVAGSEGSNPHLLSVFGSGLVFEAKAGTVDRPYFTDGTSAGTVQLSDSVEMVNVGVEFNDDFYFFGHTNIPMSANGLYKTDGVSSSVTEVVPGVDYDVILADEDNIYFSGQIYSDRGVYISDGTQAGTVKLVNAQFSDAQAANLFNYIGSALYNGKLYFIGDSSSSGGPRAELYVSDGTPEGTVVYDIDPNRDDAGYNFCYFIEREGAVFMTLQDSAHGLEPWCFDCTPDNGSVNQVVRISQESTIHVFPNPTREFVTLTSDYSIECVKLMDLHGQTIQEQAVFANELIMNVRSLPSGVYILSVGMLDGRIKTSRLIVD
ncbi:MAG: T9SS type A sorting domain-containing protein [Flavobacteriales bacterium]